MTPVTMFRFTHKPTKKSSIRSVDVFIVAENREEADKIHFENIYDFFDQNMIVEITEVLQGFKDE